MKQFKLGPRAKILIYFVAGLVAVAGISSLLAENEKETGASRSVDQAMTQEEKAELEAQQKKAQEEAAAEQAIYDKSEEGKICKRNPKWSREECKRVADKEVWIGMKLEMILEERGKPDYTNKSNYGDGDRYQACWSDYSPRCVYFDGLSSGNNGVTSYN